MTNKVNEELEILWGIRDNAKSDPARKKAQAAIDEYFLGSPHRKERKKKKIKIYDPEDEWSHLEY